MSFFPGGDRNPAMPTPAMQSSISFPSSRDIGGFSVRRALPTARRRMVGPFIFFDRMGPAIIKAGEAMDVRPHPHIGLSTVTYLFDGAIRHRDSLGTEMVIKPGDVNLMTAGRGIVHSERSPEEMRGGEMPMSGLQTWLALPDHLEEIDPAFSHIATTELPEISDAGSRARVVMGGFGGAHRRCRSTPARSMSI
jgi:redox-sensitive bicupin YhaK (pirin superfamily)